VCRENRNDAEAAEVRALCVLCALRVDRYRADGLDEDEPIFAFGCMNRSPALAATIPKFLRFMRASLKL